MHNGIHWQLPVSITKGYKTCVQVSLVGEAYGIDIAKGISVMAIILNLRSWTIAVCSLDGYCHIETVIGAK